ncbi:MAG: hypothetical protein JJU05_08975 [Verrucomicrobia bacterium]|nr:hypothetical protein [Verrucomicrobiota bacterium]MCH8526977.1 SGNH/GDSL hydrolase family protein [Kiritimatiellia bacterium]
MLTGTGGNLSAGVVLNDLFSPGMVLQQGVPIPVWGEAPAGMEVLVRLNGAERRAGANQQGRWRVEFPPMQASTEPLTLEITGENTRRIEPVFIGNVVVAAGGRQWRPSVRVRTGEIQEGLAVFTVSGASALAPLDEIKGEWSSGSGMVSSLALEIGRRLREQTGAPVGILLVHAATSLESWIPRDLLEELPAAAPIIEFFDQRGWSEDTESAVADYETRLAAWVREGRNLPLEPEPRPTPEPPPSRLNEAPATRFNGMLAPLSGLPVRGVIWAHGEEESIVGRAAQYGEVLPAALFGFRRLFDREDLPITVVQFGQFRANRLDDRAGAEMREGQWNVQKNPANRVVVSLDLGASPDPGILADRISAMQIAQWSGEAEYYPHLISHERNGEHILLTFARTGGGLEIRGGEVKDVILEDKKRSRWVRAEAVVRGDRMAVRAQGVDQPGAVRYAWGSQLSAEGTLFGMNGLPVPSFRTDESRLATAGTVRPDAVFRHSLISEQYVEDPKLPRVLLMGDSIAIGQIPTMRRYLEGKANVLVGNNFKGNGMFTSGHALGGDTLKSFLKATGPYDVIQFNMGVHEFASATRPEEQAKAYAERLRRVVEVFRTHNPDGHLIWCSSTGTHGDNLIDRFPLYLSGATAFNAAALEVMEELRVPVSDLFALTQPRVEEFIGSDRIHIRGEARTEVTEFLARNILRALGEDIP